MSSFAISTDSTADFYAYEIKEKGLYFLPLTFTLTRKNGEITEYLDDFKNEQEYKDYYNTIRSGSTTGQFDFYHK